MERNVERLVPVVAAMATETLKGDDALQATVKHCTHELAECYSAADSADPSAAETLKIHSRRFATLWVQLEAMDPKAFRCKPKLRLFQEMNEMEEEGRPAANST